MGKGPAGTGQAAVLQKSSGTWQRGVRHRVKQSGAISRLVDGGADVLDSQRDIAVRDLAHCEGEGKPGQVSRQVRQPARGSRAGGGEGPRARHREPSPLAVRTRVGLNGDVESFPAHCGLGHELGVRRHHKAVA